MGVQEVIGYTIKCEMLGCKADAVEDVSSGEYGSWNKLDELKELAKESDWVTVDASLAHNPEEWFCPAHHPTGVMAEPPVWKDPTRLPPPLFGEEEQS